MSTTTKKPKRLSPAERRKRDEWQRGVAIEFLSSVDVYCFESAIEGDGKDKDLFCHTLTAAYGKENWEDLTDVDREHFEPGKADLIDFCVDLRRSFDMKQELPPQLAEWFRGLSLKMLVVAERLDGYPDDRDLERIRRVASGKLEATVNGWDSISLRPTGRQGNGKAVTVTRDDLHEQI